MIEDFIEVRLKSPDDFLKIVETLTRIGVTTKDKKLIQTCHILHKKQKYFICHFKELFLLDGVAKTKFEQSDLERRNGIVRLLEEWNLCEIVSKDKVSNYSLEWVKVIPYSKKSEYVLKQNYTIGSRK